MNTDSAISPDELTYQEFLEALIHGNRQQARSIFEGWMREDRPVRWLYQSIIQRALYEIGTRWESGLISVATEHLATAIVENIMNLVYPRLFERPSTGHSAVVTCAANEHHQLGGKMVADMFELHGWHSYFLGANTPSEDLVRLIEEKRPDAAAFSLTLNFNMDKLVHALKLVHATRPRLPLLVGGQALLAGHDPRLEALSGLTLMTSLDELETWIDAQPR